MEHNPVCKDVHFRGRGPLACVYHNQTRTAAAVLAPGGSNRGVRSRASSLSICNLMRVRVLLVGKQGMSGGK